MIFPDAGLPVRVFSPNRFSCGTCDWLSLHGPMAVLDSMAGWFWRVSFMSLNVCVPRICSGLAWCPFSLAGWFPCWMILPHMCTWLFPIPFSLSLIHTPSMVWLSPVSGLCWLNSSFGLISCCHCQAQHALSWQRQMPLQNLWTHGCTKKRYRLSFLILFDKTMAD